MRRIISILIALSMVTLTVMYPGFRSNGQRVASGQPNPSQDPFQPGHSILHKLPDGVRIGASPEAQAALANLSPEEKQKLRQIFNDLVVKAKQDSDRKKHQDDDLPDSLSVVYKDKDGNRNMRPAKLLKKTDKTHTSALKVKGQNRYITLASTKRPSDKAILESSKARMLVKRAHRRTTLDGDEDLDGLPDEFENQVADAFTPLYRISAGEPDQFATFNDSETIQQLFGQTPVSHFRVHPEGFAIDPFGAIVGVLRIDYLTLWNQDDGLVSGAACAWNLFGLDDVIAALSGHYLDHERSAMLVAAPISGDGYNLDPSAYGVYNLYTAGHEFTIGDTSMELDLFPPLPANNHIWLGLSQSKHATYIFNPDYMPLTPWYIIAGTFFLICYYYCGTYLYPILFALAYDVFFSCIVERFTDQGGQYAIVRKNVGELSAPINNSAFIAAADIYRQFNTPVCRFGGCPF